MRKLNLTFPDEIVDELGLLCGNLPKVCRKQSQLGWSSNERILIVRNNCLEYYNLHPGFVENEPNSIKKKHFKYSIKLGLIHEVNFLPKNKIRKTHLELVFPENKKSNKPEELGRANDKNENEEEDRLHALANAEPKMEKWLFEFDFDLKDHIEKKMEERKEQKRMLAKIVPPQPLDRHLEVQSIPVMQTPKSEERNIEEYVNSVQRIKNTLKTKAEMAQEQAVRQRKKKERELAQLMNSKNQNEQTFSISSFWRDYFKYYEQTIKIEKRLESTRMQQKIEAELVLLSQIEFFNSVAVKIVQNYVEEKNIGYESPKKQFEHFEYFQGLWLKPGGKELNQQFLVNYYLNDILYSLRDVKGFKIRVPLMSLIEYKGIKLLCMCDMPFSELEKTEMYNLLEDGYDLQIMSKLKDCLEILEDVLNIKSAPYDMDGKKRIAAPLGAHLKMYEYTYKKDKSQDQIILPNFYYIINPGIAFPIDFNYQHKGVDLMSRLRPELVAFFREYCKSQSPQLLVQAFMKTSLSEQARKHEEEKVVEAARLISSYKVPQLVRMLNSLEVMFVDSYSIKSVLQELGINVRYLKLVYESVRLQYVQELILVEVMARTIKRQFRQALRDLEGEQLAYQGNMDGIEDTQGRMKAVRERKDHVQEQYKQLALDYLNLVFGVGQQTVHFWKIIREDCQQTYQISCQYPPNCKAGCLLNAVLWHCGLSLAIVTPMPLFKSQRPFEGYSDIEFVAKVKTFDFPSFEIQKLFRGAPSLQQKVALQLFKQSSAKLLKMELLFSNQLNPYNFAQQVSLAKLNIYHQYLAKPTSKNKLHPLLLPFYLSNKSQFNFKTGMEILKFSLPDTHPLAISLYIEYADIFDAKLMKKSAVLLAVKSLGQFHNKTTEMYSKYYHEGFEEYYIKAKRVKNIEACSIICKEMFNDENYESCLSYCLEQMAKMNDPNHDQKLGTGNFRIYMDMLMQGVQCAVYNAEFAKGILISKEISRMISSFTLKDEAVTESLFRQTLVIHMMLSPRKYFLYKMVLFVVFVRGRYEKLVLDSEGNVVPCRGEERQRILDGIDSEYFEKENHSGWIQWIFETIDKSFYYFNFLENLFNKYQENLKRYNSEDFMACIGYLDLFIRLYGQRFFREVLYDINLH